MLKMTKSKSTQIDSLLPKISKLSKFVVIDTETTGVRMYFNVSLLLL